MRNQRGITLVSLVVTIIVLIILAGISINVLVGQNGIITRAQQAKENMVLAEQREEEQLNELYEQLEGSNQGIPPEEETIEDLTDKLQDLQNKFDNIQREYNNFKTIIAEAITERGVETQETDSAEVMAENIKKLKGEELRIYKLESSSYSNGKVTFNLSIISEYESLTIDDFVPIPIDGIQTRNYQDVDSDVRNLFIAFGSEEYTAPNYSFVCSADGSPYTSWYGTTHYLYIIVSEGIRSKLKAL